ncbi:MFS transporter [Microbulbifer agarilyticus]|uniref:MFS transporter n=1 Tax=Microbulbifer agarilyticus TaxID=260552 RepID=UPI001CD51573|nr:MFS transporter [Microbulbifer agarilyticus]MCA0899453.1 MFS transporter [Microbulbifer agarilyticus]
MGIESSVSDEHSKRGMWFVLAMTAMCMTVVAYNTTAITTVIPMLRKDLDLTPSEVQGIMAVYMVATSSLMPIMGRCADLFGRVRTFVLGMLTFACGSLLVAISTGGTEMLLGRMLQGFGASSLFGTSLSLLTSATPPKDRPVVVGVWGAMIALGMSLGPIIGGALGQYLSWRWIFYMDLAVLGLALILVRIVSRNNYVPATQRLNKSLDILGGILLILTLGPVAYGLANSSLAGWTSPVTLASIGIGIVSGIAFWWREQHCESPLLHLDYFRHPRFKMATLGIFIAGFNLLGFFIFYNLFVQSPVAFGMSPVEAGAAVLPMTAVMLVFSIWGPKILGPYSYRWPITIGMLCLALSGILLSTVSNDSTYRDTWWMLLVTGVGFGLTIPLLPRIGLRLCAEEHTGQASGMVNACLTFGASVGSVVAGAAHVASIRKHLETVLHALPIKSEQRHELAQALANGSNSDILTKLGTLKPETSHALQQALRDVQDDAFSAAMLTCSVVSIVGAIIAVYLMRGPVPEEGSAKPLLRH